MGAIHSTKIYGNFGPKLKGLVRSNRKIFEKISLPFEMDHFSRLDRSDRHGLFHLTVPTHSQSQYLMVRYLPCTELREMLITALIWIVNSGSIGVIRTSMYSYDRLKSKDTMQIYLGKYIVFVLISLLFYFFFSLRRGDQSTVVLVKGPLSGVFIN